MDRGYIDFERLYVFTLSSAFFVVRTKSNVLIQRRYSHPVDKTTGVRSDHTVILTAINSVKAYPDQLRRVSYLKRLAFENRRAGVTQQPSGGVHDELDAHQAEAVRGRFVNQGFRMR